MQRFELDEYMKAGCMQVEQGPGLAIGIALHAYTDGRMCDGCPKFKGGQCDSYKILMRGLTQQKHEKLTLTETVREEAVRLGISISEVRRRRRQR